MSQIEEQKEKASKTLAIMLDYLGLDASLKAEEKGSKIALIVTSEDAGRIIGRKGQTLENLQLLLNRMMFKGDQEFPKLVIDIDGYSRKEKERRRGDRGDRGEGGYESRERSDRGDRDRGDRGDRGDRSENYESRENNEENEERLKQQALDAAKEVKRWGEPVNLPPLNAHDRRIIHITLQDDTELQTESIGDGAKKSIAISLKKQ